MRMLKCSKVLELKSERKNPNLMLQNIEKGNYHMKVLQANGSVHTAVSPTSPYASLLISLTLYTIFFIF